MATAQPNMKVLSKKELMAELDDIIEHIQIGAIFIYPTDTVYGLGCDARKNSVVQRVRRVKNSFDQPMSVLVPSKEWIRKNLDCKTEFGEWLDKLPGPYTLIMRRRVKDCVADDVNRFDDTLGVRIPKHWFADIVKKAGFPVVTTSLNIHGQEPCDSLQDVPSNFKMMADFAIDDGEVKGTPSTLVDLTKSPPEVIERK